MHELHNLRVATCTGVLARWVCAWCDVDAFMSASACTARCMVVASSLSTWGALLYDERVRCMLK